MHWCWIEHCYISIATYSYCCCIESCRGRVEESEIILQWPQSIVGIIVRVHCAPRSWISWWPFQVNLIWRGQDHSGHSNQRWIGSKTLSGVCWSSFSQGHFVWMCKSFVEELQLLISKQSLLEIGSVVGGIFLEGQVPLPKLVLQIQNFQLKFNFASKWAAWKNRWLSVYQPEP